MAEQCDSIKEEHECLEEAILFATNLEQVSKKMCLAVREKLRPHIKPLLDVDCPKNKGHMFFSMILDPRFLQMKSLLKLHGVESVNSYAFFSRLTSMLFEYIVAAEDKKNPPQCTTIDDSFHGDFALPDIFEMVSGEGNVKNTLTHDKREFDVYKTLVKKHFLSGKVMETSKDVLEWFKANSFQIPMISHFANIIHCMSPSQIDNERDFSLAGVIARAKRASFTVKNLAMLVFINKNKDFFWSIKSMDIFEDEFESL